MDRFTDLQKFREDLSNFQFQKRELKHIRRNLRWLRIISRVEHLPSYAKAGSVHLFVMAIHWWLYPSSNPTPARIMSRLLVWCISFTLVVSLTYLGTYITHKLREPYQQAHWGQNNFSPNNSPD